MNISYGPVNKIELTMEKKKPEVVAIIPARYESNRFPGKPLAKIDGKPMIQHVVERARAVKLLSRVVVATDDKRIKDAVEEFGGKVMLTSADHSSGTDRCLEVLEVLEKNNDTFFDIDHYIPVSFDAGQVLNINI